MIDLDIQKFFDSVPWHLIVKAVEAHTESVGGAVCQTVARRPGTAPGRDLAKRDRGTPQGSAISPVLANLFMHYA